MTRPYDLVVCDLDGTLLNSRKSFSEKTVEVIRRIGKEVPVVLATARAPRDVRACLEQLELQTPIICYNGALIYSVHEAKKLYAEPIGPDVVRTLSAAIGTLPGRLNVLVEKDDLFWVETDDDDDVRAWTLLGSPPHGVGYPTNFWDAQVDKLLIRGDHAHTIPLLEKEFGAHLIHTFSDSKRVWLEVLSARAGKAAALRWVADHYGLPLSRTVAFGDAENDIGMLQTAGLGVAMGNASEHVRSSAAHVALSHDDDGVAVVLEQLFPLGELESGSAPVSSPQ